MVLFLSSVGFSIVIPVVVSIVVSIVISIVILVIVTHRRTGGISRLLGGIKSGTYHKDKHTYDTYIPQ